MERIPLSTPEIALIGGTRAIAGVGLGLLLADKLDDNQRKAAGWSLLTVGLLTTIPIMLQLLRSGHTPSRSLESQGQLYHEGVGL